MKVRVTSVVMVAVLAGGGCAGPAQPPSGAIESRLQAAAPADSQHDGLMAHGDHRPHYGGIVMMNGNLHFEVVASPTGRYQVYFSDELRRELPASVVAEVTITVSMSGAEPKTMILQVDEAGESWMADGQPVTGAATLRVSYVYEEEAYWIDIPWQPVAKEGLAL